MGRVLVPASWTLNRERGARSPQFLLKKILVLRAYQQLPLWSSPGKRGPKAGRDSFKHKGDTCVVSSRVATSVVRSAILGCARWPSTPCLAPQVASR